MTAPDTPNSEDTRHIISPLRYALAVEALIEQQQLIVLLRQHIADSDNAGTVEPVSRGMLIRAQQLGDAVMEAMGYCEDFDDAKLLQVVAAPDRRLTGLQAP